MLHKTGQKIGSCFVHCFLLYAIAVAYLPFASCNGVRHELMPKRNVILDKLSEKSKGDYLILTQIIPNDHEKKQLEEKVNTIENPCDLEKFIQQSFENYIAYNNLLRLLLEPEQTELKQKFAKSDLDGQVKLLDQSLRPLKMLQNAPVSTQQNYIDLLKILPDSRAIALKTEIVQATSLYEVDRLVASCLPNSFKQLDDNHKEVLSKLSDHERQEILKVAMQQNDTKDGFDMHTGQEQSSKVKPNHTPTAPNTPNDAHLTISASKPDINKLIEQKVKAQQDKGEKGIPQDGWGTKLPLIGEARKQFLNSIIQFSQSDHKALKELFDKANAGSIENFFYVFFTGFSQDERIELLATMIYLYRLCPALTIKLCNEPISVSCFEKLRLYHNTTGNQLNLLKKLDKLLSQ